MVMNLTTPRQYNAVAKSLHWVTAWAIIAMLALGWTMTNVGNGNPYKFAFFQWHKSIGIAILLLSLFRVVWRLTHPVPPLPPGMKLWERAAARLTHALFYILLIVMPFTGWIIVSTSKFSIPTRLFYVVPWPQLPFLPTMENKMQINDAVGTLHGYLAFLIAGLLVLHVGAAWKHHLINRDDTLIRMAPRFMTRLLNRIGGPSLPLLLVALGSLLTSPVMAKAWMVDSAQSHITFSGAAEGSPFTGEFKKFVTIIDFDTAAPETGKITATIDIASATAGSSDRDTYLPQSDWFDVKKYATAQFVSTSIRKGAKDGCFEVDGTLTIKGMEKPVTLPFCLVSEGDHMRAQGSLTLQRTDFGLGLGQWADDSLVKHAVDVHIDVAAKPN